tara:strand:+ start:5029 stop:5934 length:906 start_codon:yes stop_codon:yes gene_type:complete
MIDISVIIVNYNVKEYIISCIESIYKNAPPKNSFEIIVVDNNSIDNSVKSIRINFPDILIIENEQNYGFSNGVNQAAKKAIGNFLFILNPDTLFVEDSLSKLISFTKKKNSIGAVGPSIVTKSGRTQQSFWRKPTLLNTILSIYHFDYLNYKKNYKYHDLKIMNVDSVSGGALLISSKIFKSLNGFNTNLFWMEDIDLCYRAQKIGYINYFFPETKIVHFQGKSAEKNLVYATSNQLISKIKFFKIHNSIIEVYILKAAMLVLSIVKIVLLSFLSPFKSKNRKKIAGYALVIHSIIFDFNN